MKILGLHDNHNATAALMIDGEIVAAISEERLTHRKNDQNFPLLATQECLRQAGLKGSDLDLVAFSTIDLCPNRVRIKRERNFTVKDWIDEQELYWKPLLIDKQPDAEKNYYEFLLKDPRFQQPHHYDFSNVPWKFDFSFEERVSILTRLRQQFLKEKFGISPEKVVAYDHHTCHQYYAYFGSPYRDEPCLIFTNDGGGDAANGTLAVARNNKIEEIARNNHTDLARIYRYITVMLGMKIIEHEFKVMGLAPYASDYEIEKCRPIFKDIFKIENGMVQYKNRPPELYFHFRNALLPCRFDGIAGAVQEMVEEVSVAWVLDNVKRYDIHRITYSGGVAMNVKMNQKLCELPEVDEFYCPTSGGDESIALGACYIANSKNNSKKIAKHIRNNYLGPSYSREEVLRAISSANLTDCKVIPDVSNLEIAGLLKDGYVIGRMSGRMEFGARSLGNRSILANPSLQSIVRKINHQIKFRDFWMPFAPSILDSYVHEYLDNKKELLNDHMTISFNTTERARREIISALHPADFTARAHIVYKEINPGFYDLIEQFAKLTGIGCLLNTSFNLHGDPVVCTPEHALHTLVNSDLDAVIMEDVLVARTRVPTNFK